MIYLLLYEFKYKVKISGREMRESYAKDAKNSEENFEKIHIIQKLN